MRRSVVGLIGGLGVVLSCARSAHADTTAHVMGTSTVGYNDNVLGDPANPAPGETSPLRTWFLEVAPGFTVFHESPRALHQFTYTHPMAVYFADNALDASSDTLSWNGMFTLSPRDELTLGTSVTRSRINAGVLRGAVGQAGPVVTPSGTGSAVTISATEGYSRDFTQQWHGLQSSSFSTATHVGSSSSDPNSYLLNAGLGSEYTTGIDGLGLLLNGGWFFTPATRANGAEVTPRQDQVLFGADARWRRDWTPRWSTRATVGAAASVDPKVFSKVLWSPTWSAGVFFFDEGPSASLVYSRTVAPNVLTGQNYLSDQLTLSAGLPFGQRIPLVLGSSVAGGQSRAIDVHSQSLTGRVRSLSADASLSWFSDIGLGAAIRYQHYRQYSDDTGPAALPTFRRNVIQLTLGGMFPARQLPAVPGGPPVRVDGGDRLIVPGTAPERPRPREDTQ